MPQKSPIFDDFPQLKPDILTIWPQRRCRWRLSREIVCILALGLPHTYISERLLR